MVVCYVNLLNSSPLISGYAKEGCVWEFETCVGREYGPSTCLYLIVLVHILCITACECVQVIGYVDAISGVLRVMSCHVRNACLMDGN